MDNEGTKLNIATAKAAAKWWGERLKAGDRKAFEASLTTSIFLRLEISGGCLLTCDYDPWDILLDAVRDAGIECRGFGFSARGILPLKHETIVRSGSIEPKEGYANWTAKIVVAVE
jgi:hypothetical protein